MGSIRLVKRGRQSRSVADREQSLALTSSKCMRLATYLHRGFRAWGGHHLYQTPPCVVATFIDWPNVMYRCCDSEIEKSPGL